MTGTTHAILGYCVALALFGFYAIHLWVAHRSLHGLDSRRDKAGQP